MRDNLASVSIDARTGPGPGTYEDKKLTTSSFLIGNSNRYDKNPFGSAKVRFEY